MKKWIKLETSISSDDRIKALIGDYGLSGFGQYVLIRCAVESQADGVLAIGSCLRGCGIKMSRAKSEIIIRNYGLFDIDERGMVSVCDDLPDLPESSRTHAPTAASTAASTACANQLVLEENKKKETDKSVSKKLFRKPSVEEVKAYCDERRNNIDPAGFCDYYESIGWVVGGKARMVDWKAAVRTWERKEARLKPTGSGVEDADDSASSKPPAVSVRSGVQYYNGRQLPPDAPPRPSDSAEWDEASGTWFELYR